MSSDDLFFFLPFNLVSCEVLLHTGMKQGYFSSLADSIKAALQDFKRAVNVDVLSNMRSILGFPWRDGPPKNLDFSCSWWKVPRQKIPKKNWPALKWVNVAQTEREMIETTFEPIANHGLKLALLARWPILDDSFLPWRSYTPSHTRDLWKTIDIWMGLSFFNKKKFRYHFTQSVINGLGSNVLLYGIFWCGIES